MKFSALITAALHKEVFSLSLLTQFCSCSESDCTLTHVRRHHTWARETRNTQKCIASADTDYNQEHSSFLALPGNKVPGFYKFVKENWRTKPFFLRFPALWCLTILTKAGDCNMTRQGQLIQTGCHIGWKSCTSLYIHRTSWTCKFSHGYVYHSTFH